ncbi:HNH endonuclease signature motif containing protein [Providencia rettgeri]|uniref:HNH endonuclease signature motif containing protein n=2 Tax=Gammaproteobacteria TaxID=1236 RepID=UPI001C3ED394
MTTGYVEIQIDGIRYKAHRLAWLYCYGVMPDKQVDHINSCKTDNRITNLREATRSQNQQNTGLTKSNKSGRKGVYFRDGKWQAQAQINGKKYHLGRHKSIDEASKVYEEFCKEKYNEFYRHPSTH